MSHSRLQTSKRLYSFLVRLYPQGYRREFGSEMQYVFTQQLRESYQEAGDQGLFRLWGRTLLDAGKSIAVQHLENTKEGVSMKTKNANMVSLNTDIARVLVGTVLILCIPILGMMFFEGWNWGPFDFIVMGTLLLTTGFALVWAKRTIHTTSTRVALIVGILFLAFWLYAELAVGIFTNWGS